MLALMKNETCYIEFQIYVCRLFIAGGSPSPNPNYVASSSFSPTRRHEAVTSSDATSARFSFWPDGKLIF